MDPNSNGDGDLDKDKKKYEVGDLKCNKNIILLIQDNTYYILFIKIYTYYNSKRRICIILQWE